MEKRVQLLDTLSFLDVFLLLIALRTVEIIKIYMDVQRVKICQAGQIDTAMKQHRTVS